LPALGGEYGGAATYVAEHAPDRRRGYYTSYIQTTATIGFFASLLDFVTTNTVVAIALALGAPFFILFGALSDRIGRKVIMMSGMLIAAVTYVPIYMAMDAFKANPPVLVLLVFVQVLYVTMVYGPIAAYLVELFPARIRIGSLFLWETKDVRIWDEVGGPPPEVTPAPERTERAAPLPAV
jgi:MFS family permease